MVQPAIKSFFSFIHTENYSECLTQFIVYKEKIALSVILKGKIMMISTYEAYYERRVNIRSLFEKGLPF